MKIKVYIAGISIGRTGQSERGIWARYTSHHMMMADGVSIDSTTFNKDCIHAIEVVREFANLHGFKYKIYDVTHDWAAFKTWVDGVKILPTVIIGKKKIEGTPTKEELEHFD